MNMKFAHYLATIERDAPEEWKGKFIKYKKLKKMLKACLTEDGTLDTAAEQHFFQRAAGRVRICEQNILPQS